MREDHATALEIRILISIGTKLAARDLAPNKLTRYAEDLAATFHQFYTVCRVVSDDEALTAGRLYAVDATRIALATVLGLLGVSAPERM